MTEYTAVQRRAARRQARRVRGRRQAGQPRDHHRPHRGSGRGGDRVDQHRHATSTSRRRTRARAAISTNSPRHERHRRRPADRRTSRRHLRLREKLGSNEAAIRAHLNAVSEVATLIAERHPALRGRRHLFGRRVRRGDDQVRRRRRLDLRRHARRGVLFVPVAGAKPGPSRDTGAARRPRLCEDRRVLGAGAAHGGSSAISSPGSSTRSIRRTDETVGAGRRADRR